MPAQFDEIERMLSPDLHMSQQDLGSALKSSNSNNTDSGLDGNAEKLAILFCHERRSK